MQKVAVALLALVAWGFGAIGSLTIPHEVDSAAIPKVIYIDQNNDSIVNKVNEIKDTVNLYLPGSGTYTGTALTSTGSLRLTVDSDANGTGHCVAVTHNSATDTIAKFCDDLASKFFGAVTGTNLTLSGLTASRLMASDGSKGLASVADLTSWIAGTSNQIASTSDGDGSLTLSLPSAVTLPGSAQVTTTLGTTGLHTASGGVNIAGGSHAQGSLYSTSALGLTLAGKTGSSYDLALLAADAGYLIRNPTGTRSLEFPGTGTNTFTGAVSMASTLGVTGVANLASRLNVGGAADNASFALNVSGGSIGLSGSNSILSYGMGNPGDANYERMSLIHTGSAAELRSQALGTGTVEPLRLVVGSTTRYDITDAGAHTVTGPVSMSSTLDVTGNLTVGAGVGAPTLSIRGAAGNTRGVEWRSGSNLRWFAYAGSGAESGSDAGSPFRLSAYTDAGVFIDNVLDVTRVAGGTFGIGRPVSMSSTLSRDGDDIFTQTTHVLRANTSDASDNKRLILAGGGSTGSGRSAYASFHGNEFASDPGDLILTAGNVSGGQVIVRTGADVDRLTISDAGVAQFSGTLGVTGLTTATGGIAIAGGTTGAGRLFQSATDGLVIRAMTGSGSDFALYSQDQGTLIANPTGTRNITVGNGSGSVTIPGTATTTGVHTFTAAPVFNSVTASQFLLVDGSKSLTSVAGTGSGSVVRATSPTLTTPNIGAATGTSLNTSGTISSTSGFVSGAILGLSRNNTSSGVIVTGGTSGADGANAYFFGSTDALTPNHWQIRHGTTNDIAYNGTNVTVTPPAVFTAAPTFSSVTASQTLEVDGSKALTSVAQTGTGSYVKATSPTLVTPNIGAATGTSLNLSGSLTADTIISAKFYEEGTFTGTLTGVTTTVTGTLRYTRIGKVVTLYIPSLTGTSNSTSCSITGMPAAIRPARQQDVAFTYVRDNGTGYSGYLSIGTGGVIDLNFWLTSSSLGVFTSSGDKGVLGGTITYSMQ